MRTVARIGFLVAAAGLCGAGVRLQPADDHPAPILPETFAAKGAVGEGLTIEATWPIPPNEAFALMTDSSAWKDRFQLETRIDLAIGGRFELLFGAGVAPEGQQGSEGCQILSYVPGEMLSFSWNAPPSFEERAQHTWVVITFTPGAEAGTTDLRLRHVGFGQGGRWSEVQDYFQNAWTRLLGAMAEDLR